MRVGRVRIFAPITSFRFPHFLVGRQPSYDLPPPSTIYGQIASAVGSWPDRSALLFAYTFKCISRGADLEHQHIVWQGPPDKLGPEQSAAFRKWKETQSLSIGGAVQPTWRDFLFNAELTLYIHPSEVAAAFRQPVFPVVLGRSQDLACVETVEEIELQSAPGAYLENTLLPFSWRPRTGFGTTVLMSRYISPPPHREPQFERYVALRSGERLYAGDTQFDRDSPRYLLDLEGETVDWWVDPTSPESYGVRSGVVLLSFQSDAVHP